MASLPHACRGATPAGPISVPDCWTLVQSLHASDAPIITPTPAPLFFRRFYGPVKHYLLACCTHVPSRFHFLSHFPSPDSLRLVSYFSFTHTHQPHRLCSLFSLSPLLIFPHLHLHPHPPIPPLISTHRLPCHVPHPPRLLPISNALSSLSTPAPPQPPPYHLHKPWMNRQCGRPWVSRPSSLSPPPLPHRPQSRRRTPSGGLVAQPHLYCKFASTVKSPITPTSTLPLLWMSCSLSPSLRVVLKSPSPSRAQVPQPYIFLHHPLSLTFIPHPLRLSSPSLNPFSRPLPLLPLRLHPPSRPFRSHSLQSPRFPLPLHWSRLRSHLLHHQQHQQQPHRHPPHHHHPLHHQHHVLLLARFTLLQSLL